MRTLPCPAESLGVRFPFQYIWVIALGGAAEAIGAGTGGAVERRPVRCEGDGGEHLAQAVGMPRGYARGWCTGRIRSVWIVLRHDLAPQKSMALRAS